MKEVFEKNKPLILLSLCILVVLFGIILLLNYQSIDQSEDVVITNDSNSEEESEKAGVLRVDIQGAVSSPGVYEFYKGQLIDDAIERAGGFTESVDLEYVSQNINRAKKLEDEQKIYIPKEGENMDKENSDTTQQEASSEKININTASLEQLDSLPGIGPSYAKKIIEGRPYSKIEDIKKVKGIGDSTFEKVKDLITV